jgi:integrase
MTCSACAPRIGQTRATRRPRSSVCKRDGRFHVRVYAGQDPVTRRPHYLTESAGDEKQADRILRRLLTEVDEQRNAPTKATLGTAIDSWLRVHDAEASTLDGYAIHTRLYVRPALGDVPVGKISAQMLEELYAQLRRCRARCNGRPFIEHRVDGPHECRVVKHRRPPGRRPAAGYPPHDCDAIRCKVIECAPHVCRPLAQATLRQVHNTVSGALSAAVRWEWIKSKSRHSRPQAPSTPPRPGPSPEQAMARGRCGSTRPGSVPPTGRQPRSSAVA